MRRSSELLAYQMNANSPRSRLVHTHAHHIDLYTHDLTVLESEEGEGIKHQLTQKEGVVLSPDVDGIAEAHDPLPGVASPELLQTLQVFFHNYTFMCSPARINTPPLS